MHLPPPDYVLQRFLRPGAVLDFDEPSLAAKARQLLGHEREPVTVARTLFTFVRDEIRHSLDAGDEIVTLCASQVLREQTGLCYAKSHLLAALLRAANIPAGLCYQRLCDDDRPGRFLLHGLVAVFLPVCGWLRLDPRGDKPGIHTDFDPTRECLAFHPSKPGEIDLPEVFANPLPCVIASLSAHSSMKGLLQELPDVVLYADCSCTVSTSPTPRA